MRILIYGAGAIGSFLGCCLWRSGHSVTLVGRDDVVTAVRRRGLIVDWDPSSDRHSAPGLITGVGSQPGLDSTAQRLDAVASIGALEPRLRSWDLVVVTVKAFDSARAAADLSANGAAETPWMLVQNGVGGEELALQAFPQAHLLTAVITLSVSVVRPGHVRLETSRGGLCLAQATGGMDVHAWREVFAGAGFRVASCDDYRRAKWSKLLLNILANALPAILDMPPSQMFRMADLFSIERSAFIEARQVMRGLQLRPLALPGYPVPLLVWALHALPSLLVQRVLGGLVGSGRGGKAPSLQLDLVRGRARSEVEFLNGAVVGHADRLGLPVPVNRFLTKTLLAITSGRLSWETFRHKPKAVLDALCAAKEQDDEGFDCAQ